MYSQSRIFFVMSRDGLLPKSFAKVHKKYDTPYVSCIAVTLIVAVLGGFAPIHTIASMSSLGTLFAVIMAVIAAMVLRIKRPKLERPFRCPAIFVIAPIAILVCGYLLFSLLVAIIHPFLIWLVLSLLGYFFYAYKKSPLQE